MSIAENDAPPLGLLYVAAAARQSGLVVSVIDMNHPPMDAARLAAIVEQRRPRIVAFSVLTPSSGKVKDLVAMLKGRFPRTDVIAGGVHASALPSDLINAGVDFVVVGEGETTFVEVAEALLSNGDVAGVAGLAYPEHGSGSVSTAFGKRLSMCITARRDPHTDLDALPRPARDLVPILEYGQSGALCSSRGCPYSCSFCSSVLSGGHKYRLRTVDCVMDEIADMHAQFGISHFQFLDDNFAAVPDRAESLVASLRKRGYVWSCQTSVMELVDRTNLLSRMYEAGCREVYFGLESGSRRILNQYKSIDLDRAMAVLTHAASFGKGNGIAGEDALQTVVGFMVGHPEDDEDSIEETIQFALTLRPLGIDTMISIMQPYPGSLIHQDPGRYGLNIEKTDYAEYLYPKANMATRKLSRKHISRLYAKGLLRIMQTY